MTINNNQIIYRGIPSTGQLGIELYIIHCIIYSVYLIYTVYYTVYNIYELTKYVHLSGAICAINIKLTVQ